MITYATKCWKEDVVPVLQRHPKANLVVGNNLGFSFMDIGETDDPYYEPELSAVHVANTEHILWYAGDVIPPPEHWVNDALPLLDKYPIVTANPWGDNVEVDKLYGDRMEKTNFGWLTQHFSDQCYLSTSKFMKQIDYNAEHAIAADYPAHGGNSFERRVAQYLASTGQYVAVLKDYHYRHIDARLK